MNPAANFTWTLIDGLIKEAATIFPDTWIHLGGDEVSTACWGKTESVEEWMAANNYTQRAAYGYFVKKAMGIAYNEYNKQVINWVEVFNNFNTSLDPKETVIEVWKSKSLSSLIPPLYYPLCLHPSQNTQSSS